LCTSAGASPVDIGTAAVGAAGALWL